jgi:hypothetical protein
VQQKTKGKANKEPYAPTYEYINGFFLPNLSEIIPPNKLANIPPKDTIIDNKKQYYALN